MSEDNLTLVLVAAIGLIGVVLQTMRSRRHTRDEIEQDLRIIAALPRDSRARSSLLSSVESRVLRVSGGVVTRREPFGMVIALFFLSVVAVFVWQALTDRGWWLLLLIPAAPFFALSWAGFATDARKVPRNPDGTPVAQ